MAEYCVTTANGTDAITLILKALGLGEGDKIVTAPNAGGYATLAINSIGAEAVYVDIDPFSMTLSPDRLAETLNCHNDIKAIVVTHLYGALADMETIVTLSQARHIPVIEDCSQAHGANYNGQFAGTFGIAGAYSFYPTKNLGALGDAGAIITNNKSLCDKAIKLRQYGWGSKYITELSSGQNSRMDELQAAFLNAKLPRLDAFNEARKAIVRRYAECDFKHLEILYRNDTGFVAHLAVIRTDYRDELCEFLEQHQVDSDIHFPLLDSQQSTSVQSKALCPEAEKCVSRILSIPCYPTLGAAQQDYIIDRLYAFDSSI